MYGQLTAAKTRYPLISITCTTHRGHVIFGRRTLTIVNAVNVSNGSQAQVFSEIIKKHAEDLELPY